MLTSRSTNNELIRTAKATNVPLAWVGFKDHLSAQPIRRKMLYIVNMQSSPDGVGTHWVCFFLSPKHAFYFDSFGIISPLEIEEYFRLAGYKSYYCSNREVQNINGGYCGSYCLEFGEYMSSKRLSKSLSGLARFQQFISKFSPEPEKNLVLLKQMMREW